MQTTLYGLRKQYKLTQKDLSELLNISRTAYANKERGERPFNADEMFTIAHIFDRKMEDIFLPTKAPKR